MYQKIIFAVTLLVACLTGSSIGICQYPNQGYQSYGPPMQSNCASGGCNGYLQAAYGYDQAAYPGNGCYSDNQAYFGGQPEFGCFECGPGPGYQEPCYDQGPIPRRFDRRDRRRTRKAIRSDRYGGRGITYGREGNEICAPFIDGECGDCNWGPIYVSIFAGVAFIDNFDSRFTFDNGMMGMLGVMETGFTTLDGVAAGGALGRYFYRQARVEFEYTFRDNGIGDMTEFTFSDDLSTPQINDMLVSSVITPANGNMQSNSFMFNFVADMRPRTVGCLNAYLGGGIGVLYVDSDITTGTALFEIDDTSFAFQGIAGINFPMRDRLDLFTEYRYLGADSIRVRRMDMAGIESLGAFRFDSHNVVFGLRFLR